MSVTEQLAAFTAHLVYEDVPSQAYARAKDAILDGLSCALVGSLTSTGKIIVQYVRDRGGESRAGVIGGGFKTSAPLAALANGTMAHALDFDDVNDQAVPSRPGRHERRDCPPPGPARLDG